MPMIIRSDFLTEGLFGQAFTWLLEVLPYVDKVGCKPKWEILTKNYGTPPTFNIFPDIIETRYEPDGSDEVIEFETLQRNYKHNFRHDFAAAKTVWDKHFNFTADVLARLDAFAEEYFDGHVVLGVHYRGTDKNVDTYQTNCVTRYQLLCIVEDFLSAHSEVDTIFVASDDSKFIDAVSKLGDVVCHEQARSSDDKPLWNSHETFHNQTIAKEAILDCLTLSKCKYGLKCMSQLSAFSKIMNPALNLYRVSACKVGWFPEAYVPPYSSSNKAVQSLLSMLQQDDFQCTSLYQRATGVHRQIKRLSKQVWRKSTPR
jgi:hypothetical protein